MPNFNYTSGLPNPTHLPSQDVNDMQINCNSIEDIWDEDHFGFNDNNGGWHQNVRLQNHAAPGNPVFSGDPGGVLYSNNPIASANNPGWPFWQNNLGTFQITGSAAPNPPSVGSATNPISSYSNGWTFLPGGFILQWGIILIGTGVAGNTIPVYTPLVTTPVLFVASAHTNDTNNINFPNECFNVQATLIPSPGPIPAPPTTAATISVSNLSTTGFSFRATIGSYIGFYWTALGR